MRPKNQDTERIVQFIIDHKDLSVVEIADLVGKNHKYIRNLVVRYNLKYSMVEANQGKSEKPKYFNVFQYENWIV